MSPNKSSSLHKEVTCPFCNLLCDDLSIRNTSEKLSIEKNACSKAIRGFERNEPKVGPSIHGVSVHIDEAIKHAAYILRNANHALFAGSSTDVGGSRELMALAEKSNAVLDHVHGDGMMNNTHVLQTQGWIMTTLAELKNRADLIIFVGTDAVSHYPRFYDRFIWNQSSLAGLKKNARDIVYVGDVSNTKAGINPNGKRPTHIKCSKKETNETLSIIRALLKDSNVESGKITPRRLSALKKLVARVKEARYGVIVWDGSEFPASDGDITIHTISAILKELNNSSRFAGISLGGNNGGTSFMNVCGWQSGYPMRVSFKQGYPEYDPYSFASKKILREKSTDALLWLSSFDTSLIMPRVDVPTIILSRPSKRLEHAGEVYIPIGTPGVDHIGNLLRTDSVVSLPLKKLRGINLPSSSEILNRIRKAI